MANRWRCGSCGYRLEADVPPEQCPGCHERCEFIDANPYVPADQGKTTGYEAVAATWQPRVVAERCTGCAQCLEACPIEAIEIRDGLAWVDPEICCGDGICVPACPEGAIVVPE